MLSQEEKACTYNTLILFVVALELWNFSMPDRQIVLSAVRSDASAIQLTGCNLRTRSALVMQAPQIWKLTAWHIITPTWHIGINFKTYKTIELKKSSSLAEWSPFAVFVSSYKLIRSIRVIDTAFHGACCSLSFWTFLNRSYAHWFERTSKWIRLSVPMPMWKNSCHWSVGLVFDALCKGRKSAQSKCWSRPAICPSC